MWPDEARWIEETLAALDLRPGASVLDVGSSTARFRTVEQPFIDAHIFAPLRARGAEVVHLDAKPLDGVDVVCDLTDPAVDVAGQIGRTFDVVLCCNLLEHVRDRAMTIDRVTGLVAPGGTLVVTVPGRYRYHEDPIDTMYRPTPEQLEELIITRDGSFTTADAVSISVTDRSAYRLHDRGWRYRAIELLSWLVPAYHWRQSCVRLSRAAEHLDESLAVSAEREPVQDEGAAGLPHLTT